MSRLRKLDCVHYDRCLSFACDEDWICFECTKCKAYEELSDKEKVKQGLRVFEALRKL